MIALIGVGLLGGGFSGDAFVPLSRFAPAFKFLWVRLGLGSVFCGFCVRLGLGFWVLILGVVVFDGWVVFGFDWFGCVMMKRLFLGSYFAGGGVWLLGGGV